MNKQNKKKVVVTVLMASIIIGAAVYAAMGHAYQVGFNDGLGVNRDGDGPTLHGYLTVLVKRGDSQEWAFILSKHNLITNAGRLDICDYIGATAGASFDYIGVGTGEGGTAASTDLVTPFSTRAQGTFAEPCAYNWTITYTFAAGFFSGQNITEYGVFNAATTGTMLSYQDDSGTVLSSADSLQVQFEYMVTDAG